MRTVFAWAVLVPVGSMLLGAGLMAAVPGGALMLLGILLWKWADHLLGPQPTVQDELWRSYMSHPSVVGPARRKVRDSR